nr:hypothetical protein [Corynebacterium gerontici]
MTMQRRPLNPIEHRKAQVRKYSRTAAIGVGGGAGLVILGILTQASMLITMGMVLAVVMGGFGVWKVREIINHKDPEA